MSSDLRFAFRQLRKSPGFTLVAVLTLALGIGANTAIFSFINAFFLKNFSVKSPQELVSIYTTDEHNPGFLGISRYNYEDYRDQNQVFTGVACYGFAPANVLLNGEPSQIFGELVSGNFFDLLGVRATLGRTFIPDEYKTIGAQHVVVLGYSFWQTKLGGDRGVLGRTLTLNGTPFTIIGVAPADFRGLNTLNSPSFWVTTASYKQILNGTLLTFYDVRRALLFNAVARLKPGITLTQAEASLKPISVELARQFRNDNNGRGVRLVSLAESGIDPNQRQNFKRAGTLLLSLSGVVLLIACANIANLLLARAHGRQREVALRLAIGADRGALMRQFLTESVVLALFGGFAGLVVAQWTQHLLWSVRPPFFPQDFMVSLDSRVLGFGLLIALATGILFGLAPAWNATKLELTNALKSETAGAAARAPLVSFRNILVAGQIALSVIALIVAGLFIRSLQNARHANVGWNAKNLALLSVDVGAQGYGPDQMITFYRSAIEKARSIPGVIDATIATAPLLNGGGFLRTLRPQGDNENLRTHGSLMSYSYVWPGYLKTIGIPLVAGREFTEMDDPKHPLGVIINEHLAKDAWPNRSPLGQAIKLFGTEVPAEVVGVMKDTVLDNIGEDPKYYVFFCLAQDASRGGFGTLHVRTERDVTQLIPTLRKEIQSLDPALPFVNVTTMDENIRQGLWASRTGAALLSVFGGLALLLAAIGIYGIMSYSVGKRVREIGIRMAIGAQSGDVLRLILGQGLIIAATGLAVGLIAAFGVARYFENFLFGVRAGDALTYLAIAAILGGVTLLACWLPARRATKVDPLTALHAE
jgi:predicted permease